MYIRLFERKNCNVIHALENLILLSPILTPMYVFEFNYVLKKCINVLSILSTNDKRGSVWKILLDGSIPELSIAYVISILTFNFLTLKTE